MKNQTISQNKVDNKRKSEEMYQSLGRAEIIANLLHLFIILVARGMRWESWFKVHVDGECPETDSEVRSACYLIQRSDRVNIFQNRRGFEGCYITPIRVILNRDQSLVAQPKAELVLVLVMGWRSRQP